MNEFTIVLDNKNSYTTEGKIEYGKYDNQLKIVLENYDKNLFDYLFYNNSKIEYIYGNFNDKKIILKSYYIEKFNTQYININVIIAIFYDGIESDFYTIQSDFNIIDNVNIHYNFLNYINDENKLDSQNLSFKKINNDRYINFKFNNNILDNIKYIHKKICTIYQLLTSKELTINDLYLESESGKYYIFNSNFIYSDKNHTMYSYEIIVYNNFIYLLNELLNVNSKLETFIDDFIINFNYRGLLENQIIILVAMVEFFDSREKNDDGEKIFAKDKIKNLLNHLPTNIKKTILLGFERNELFLLKDSNISTEDLLMSLIVNNRVYRTHGKERKRYTIKELKGSLLVTKWLKLIIHIFLLYKINLNDEDLLCIVKYKIEKINNIIIIES